MPNTIRKPYIVGMGPIPPAPFPTRKGMARGFARGLGFYGVIHSPKAIKKPYAPPLLVGTGGAYNERSE